MRTANAWLRDLARDGTTASPRTWRTYANALRDFFLFLEAWQLGWKDNNQNTLADYRNAQKGCDRDGTEIVSGHTGKPLCRSTVNFRLQIVARFYAYASENGYIPSNPIKYKVVRLKRLSNRDMLAHLGGSREHRVPVETFRAEAKQRIKWCSDAEVSRWINSIESSQFGSHNLSKEECWRDKLLALVIYTTGMRREEPVNIHLSQLPCKGDMPLSGTGDGWVPVEIVGKGRKRRVVCFRARDIRDIWHYIEVHRTPMMKRNGKTHDYIFVNRSGNPLKPEDVTRIFERVSARTGVKMHPHKLRHSFAMSALAKWKTLFNSETKAIKLLQARLGHEDVATTRNIYLHQTEEDKADEAKANAVLIEEILQGGML